MPLRSPPPNREAVERVLLFGELEAIRTSASELGVPPDRWTQVEPLAYWWGTVAASRWVVKLQQQFGISEDRALVLAAMKLGLKHETLRSRLKRLFQQGYGL